MQKTYIVVSDLHIFRSQVEPDDPFVGEEGWTRAVARFSELSPARLILNGDTFDLLAGAVTIADVEETPALSRFQDILRTNAFFTKGLATFLDRHEANEVQLLPGNHDPHVSLPAFVGVFREYVAKGVSERGSRVLDASDYLAKGYLKLEIDGACVLVDHGDDADFMNRFDRTRKDCGAAECTAGVEFTIEAVNRFRRNGYRWIDALQPQGVELALVMLLVDWDAAWKLAWPLASAQMKAVLSRLEFWATRRSLGQGASQEPTPTDALEAAAFDIAMGNDFPIGGPQHLDRMILDVRSVVDAGAQPALAGGLGRTRMVCIKVLQWLLRVYWHRIGAERFAWKAETQAGWRVDDSVCSTAVERAGRIPSYGVVYGHTHLSRAVRAPGPWPVCYVNTGTWARVLWPQEQMNYVAMERWLQGLSKGGSVSYAWRLSYAVARVNGETPQLEYRELDTSEGRALDLK